ncbi:MAG: hypothetical protein HY319_12860 [Armatimonadetes bacterium]|nr:hypothetical protein [Armatimonadota bacterium]
MMKPVTRMFDRARDAFSSFSRRGQDREVFLAGFLTLTARRRNSGEVITLMTNRMSARRVRFITPGHLILDEIVDVELPIAPGRRIITTARVREVGPTAHGQLGVLELGAGREVREVLSVFLSAKKAS